MTRVKLAPTFTRKEGDFFISSSQNFIYLLKRIRKQLDASGFAVLHGTGRATLKTCAVALKLKQIYGDGIKLESWTSSEVMRDQVEERIEKRFTSCIHTRLSIVEKQCK